MADTPRKDHWASLLESIGLATATPQKPAAETATELAAEVPAAPAPAPEAEAAPAPVESAPAAAAAASEPPKPAAKKPAKTSGHWGKLAGMLGLSVPQPEPEPEPEPVAEVAPPPPAFTPAPVHTPAPVAESRVETRAPISDDLPADLFAPPTRAGSETRSAPAPRERERGRDRDRGGRGSDSRSRDDRPAEVRAPESRPAEIRSEARPTEVRSEGRRDSRDGERAPERSSERGSDRGGRSERGRGRDDRRDDAGRRPPRSEGPPRSESPPRRGFGAGVTDDWQSEAHAEPAAEAHDHEVFEHDDFVPAAPRDLPARDERDEPAAADDRLGFDRPTDEGESGPRRRRRRRGRGGRRDEEETRAHAPHSDHPAEKRDLPEVESFNEEPFVDDDYHAEVPLVDEDLVAEEDRPARRAPGDSEGGEDRGPRRRRRRRRAGSSVRRDDAAEAPRSAPAPRTSSRDDDSDLEDDFEAERPFETERAPPPPPRGRPQRDTRRAPVAAEDDEVDEMLQAELEEDGGEGHAHKKIPTWQDTVGVLIDGNMSMRSERPETRGGRGRRPPHRGR